MKVSELIEKLKEMPQDKTVMIYDGEYGYHYDLSEALETSDPQTSEEIVEVF